MTWVLTDNTVGHQPVDETRTTARYPLGTIKTGYDPTYGGGEFIYLLGVASTVVGSQVTYSPSTHQTALSPNTANTGAPVAYAMSANVASQYGWYQISGVATAKKTAVAVSPGVKIYQSATTGRVMPTAASGKQILGAFTANVASVTATTSTVLLQINRPHMQGQTT